MRVCKIYRLGPEGEEEIGAIMLDGTNLTAEYQPSYGVAINRLFLQPNVVGEDKVTYEQDPKAWFDALPTMYHGTYFWAKMGDDPVQSIAGLGTILRS